MGCLTDRLSNDILADCKNLVFRGIEADLLLIPHSDVDKTATTFDPENPMVINDLVLKPGATGYLLEGVKQVNGYNTEFVVGDDQTLDKYQHNANGRILSPTAENRLQVSKLAKGEGYMVIAERKWKGPGSNDAFILLGWDAGLYLSESIENPLENEGAITIGLASREGMLETEGAFVVLDTDYDTTKTAFENKFAAE